MRLLLTIAVAVLDGWAILSILKSGARTRSRVFWILIVVALPVVGVLVWRRARPATHAPVKA